MGKKCTNNKKKSKLPIETVLDRKEGMKKGPIMTAGRNQEAEFECREARNPIKEMHFTNLALELFFFRGGRNEWNTIRFENKRIFLLRQIFIRKDERKLVIKGVQLQKNMIVIHPMLRTSRNARSNIIP